MNNPTNTTLSTDTSASLKAPFFERVVNNEAAKKGIAAAGAGILVAAITELLWPSR